MTFRSSIRAWRDRRATERFLSANPDFRSRLSGYDATLDAKAARETPVVEELRRMSIDVGALDELPGDAALLADATPVLVRWMQCTDDVELMATIAWVLRHLPQDSDLACVALDAFRRSRSPFDPSPVGPRSMIAAAVADLAGEDLLDDLVAVALEREHGGSRSMIVRSLGRLGSDRPRLIATAVSLLGDETVVVHALEALADLDAREAVSLIEPLLDHPQVVVRSQAGSTLRRLTGHPRGTRRHDTAP